MTEAQAALAGLGMSEKGMEKAPWTKQLHIHVALYPGFVFELAHLNEQPKVLKAFTDDEGKRVSHRLLISHCSELAEDLLDHALWRVFTAAGEDHRGVLGAAELEKALAESGGSGADKAGGEGPGTFGSLLLIMFFVKSFIYDLKWKNRSVLKRPTQASFAQENYHL